MRLRRRGLLAAFLSFVPPTAALAEDAAPAPIAPKEPAAKRPQPFLWVIDGPPRVYLYGTMHLPDPRVMDHAPSVKAAHAAADVVWGELPADAKHSPEVMKAVMLPPDQSLSTVLPKETYDKLEAYLKARGLSASKFERLKPIYLAITVGTLDQLHLLMRPSMDEKFLRDAAAAGKEAGGLETISEQLAVFDACPCETQARLLDEVLVQLEKEKAEGKNSTEELIQAYAKADLAAVEASMKKMEAVDDPEVKALAKRLLTDRNATMADRIVERTKVAPEKTYFVAVGAAHYPGPSGILAILAAKGWKARRMDADETVPARAPVTTEPARTAPAKEPAGAPR
jgi:uncharacterized protein